MDDNETNRGILLHQTASLGMRPESAAGGEEALQKLRTGAANDDPYALAILDMQMASMDGLTLARSIKADPAISSTRLLLMTSLGPRSDTAALRAAGIGAFLVKPVKQSQLIDCLATLTTPSPQHETRFWLNRKDGKAADASAKRPKSSKPFHILVAEDNPINQKVAIGLLDKLGYRAEAVANGAEVMRATELVSYDIIFMDCQLPEMDGYKTTSEIRRREATRSNNRKRIYIIAMTAHAMRGAREKCLAAGMDDYISKPVHLETLKAVLGKAIDEVQHPQSVAAKLDTKGGDTMIDQSALTTLRTLRQPGKPDPVAELIDIFLRDTPGRLSEIKTAAEQYDAYTLELVAHSLRGCSSSVGACRMAELCSQLEEHARLGSIQIASHLLKQLDQEFGKVRAALEFEKLA